MKMKKILGFMLAVCMAFGCAGCKDGDSDDIDIPKKEEESIEYTDYKLVAQGKSEYKIVIEDGASDSEKFASTEIENLFKEATGIKLSTVTESQVTYGANSKLIILGNTRFTSKSKVDVSKINDDGFTVKTVDSNLFILGSNDGVVYGVYEFLEKAIGFEYYVADTYALNKGVTDLKMPKLNISDCPDIPYRVNAWNAETSKIGKYRARVKDLDGAFMCNGMYYVHNTFSWLPPEDNKKTHEKWYSDDESQLCYTAHGDSYELASMQSAVLEKMKEQINYYFGKGDFRQALSFTQQDSTESSWCNCEACTENKNKYGAESSSLIKFLNPIARDLKAWLNQTWAGHEVSIVFFAYQATEGAPVKTENGKYVPIDSTVKMEDNLSVWIAPVRGDYIRNINDVNNLSIRSMFNKWSVLSDSFYVWTYDTNFKNYLMWYDTFNSLQDLYKFTRTYNVKYHFNQGQIYSGSNFTGFDVFKIALNYKLMWDADTDVEKFTDNFFNAWFGEASSDMRKYYESFRSWSEYAKTENGLAGHIYIDGYNKEDYPKQVLSGWLENIENAYKSIENLKQSSPSEYTKIYNRITAESMAIRFALIQIHGDNDKKQAFKQDAQSLGFKMRYEGVSINDLWDKWDI